MKRFINISFLIFIFLLSTQIGYAQSENNNDENYHSPKKATIYSAVLPGLGQAYNKKYWKIPIVYVGIGAFTYLAMGNQSQFNRYKSAYLLRQDGGVDEFTDVNGVVIYNNTALLDFMDQYRKTRDLCIIGVVVVYAIQIVDANVDANLFNFDISDDLSLKVFPQSVNTNFTRTPTVGVGVQLNF